MSVRARALAVGVALVVICGVGALAHAQGPAIDAAAGGSDEAVTIRVAAWHLPGLRTEELVGGDSTRVKQIAEVLQRLRPNVVVLSGLAYDVPGAPGVASDSAAGQNGRRFVEGYLQVAQAGDIAPLPMTVFFPPTNSGQASGLDLDRSGRVVTAFSKDASASSPGYSGDSWGPGHYPGQHGLMVLVDLRLTMDSASARTFRLMPWDYVPSASIPPGPGGQGRWYSEEQLKTVRLMATTAVDLPVTLPNGATVHVLSSLPSRPGGVDDRLARRHRDEIRFWADYAEGLGYIVDDAGRGGGLSIDASFVLLGQFWTEPVDGSALRDPIASVLFATNRVNASVTPRGEGDGPAEATGRDGRRTTYVLPSEDLGIVAAGVYRFTPMGAGGFPSEHFPVWMDLWVRGPVRAGAAGPVSPEKPAAPRE